MMSVSSVYLSFVSLTSPIEMPATGCAMGTPASIIASVALHTLAIELEPLDSMMSEIMRIGVGEPLWRGNDPFDRPFRQAAVADFPAARTADGTHLAHRIGREIIVQHEAVGRFAEQAVDALLDPGACPASTVASDWVSPRVKRADPCTRGKRRRGR